MARKQSEQNALQAEYRTVAALADSFAAELVAQLRKLVADAGISLAVPIQSRIKSWASIEEKFERVQLQVKTIGDVQDLIGLRVILLFRRDVQRVVDLIGEHFSLIRSYDAGQRLKTDQFGYLSAHLIVGLPKTWLAVPTLASFGHLQAEIQVRTLAQHMWAETSQVLQYKREDTVPPSVRRGLYRGSALLELLDLEFERILEERGAYRDALDTKTTDESLNVDNLEDVLDSLLPAESKDQEEPFAELLRELQHFGIDTTGKLRTLIDTHIEAAVAADKKRVKDEQEKLEKGETVSGTSADRVRRGLFFTHTGYLRNMIRDEFGNQALTQYWNASKGSSPKG